ncbi:MAG: hypothetical protein NTZ26_11030 [Candidatus Aminicenantes bacterium]|nr:hypothetical protein [Candidatus Aminicenantes bacterium]
MRKARRPLSILAAVLAFAVLPSRLPAQEAKTDPAALRKSAPKVFLDCKECDVDYIRTEIPFVNYVRDRKEADVHVLITTQSTGSGGTEYTLAFIGQGACAGLDNKLIYASNKTATEEEIRRGYVGVLRMGLIPYAARTPIRSLIKIELNESLAPTDVVDPWKFWVFSLSVGGELDQQSQTKDETLSLLATAAKITPGLMIRLGLYSQLTRQRFMYEEETILSDSDSQDFAGLVVKSLGEHWSAGVYLSVSSSTFRNLKSKLIPNAAVEYDLCPYSQSTRRQLRFLYRVGPEMNRYREETIYDKMRETLFAQTLSATLEIKEPWGSLSAGLEGSNYFHDFAKNRLQLQTELSFRIFKGLEFNVDGFYERVRDQLSLPKGGASLEEVLLERRELATEYNLGFQVSLSYTFGSIFSNVVNPRFGTLGLVGHDHYD